MANGGHNITMPARCPKDAKPIRIMVGYPLDIAREASSKVAECGCAYLSHRWSAGHAELAATLPAIKQ